MEEHATRPKNGTRTCRPVEMLIAFNKPFGVLSRFTSDASTNRTLAEFGFPERVYPIGRLDADSEGLLLLSDEPKLNQRLLHPRHAHEREYWVQVERIPTAVALRQLEAGIVIQGHKTLPSKAWIWSRNPKSHHGSRRSVLERPCQRAGWDWSWSKGKTDRCGG